MKNVIFLKKVKIFDQCLEMFSVHSLKERNPEDPMSYQQNKMTNEYSKT